MASSKRRDGAFGFLGAGASGLAIAAALAVLTPEAARACTFVPLTDAGAATGVNVFCDPGDATDPSSAFATTYGPAAFTGDPTVYTYDGSGADTLNMRGGQILEADGTRETPSDNIDGGVSLDARTNTVELLGGDDRVNFDSGAIGAAGAPVSVLLGDGANVFAMSGGTLTGSVFGGDDLDDFRLTGGTIAGLIFAGAGDDLVLLDGATVGSAAAAPDAIGLEGGDDSFDMRSGAVTGAVSGGGGTDLLEVSGGTISGFLAGNAGVDTIRVTGGAIADGVQGNEGADQVTLSGGTIGAVTGDEDDDTITVRGTADVEVVFGGTGSDTLTVTGGTVGGAAGGNVNGDAGDDTIVLSGGSVAGADGGDGDDALTLSGDAQAGALFGSGGDDTIRVQGGTVTAQVDGDFNEGDESNDGDDTITVSGGRVGSYVASYGGADRLTFSGGAVGGDVLAGGGADQVTVDGGSIEGAMQTGAGDDAVAVAGGNVAGGVAGGDGGDTIELSGGSVGTGVAGNDGNDQIAVVDDARVEGSVSGGDGADAIGVQDGTVTEDLDGGDGDDAITVAGNAAVGGAVSGGAGSDTLSVRGGTVANGLDGGGDADNLVLSGGTIQDDVTGGDGGDTMFLSGTAVTGDVGGGDGADTISVTAGRASGAVTGGAGDDTITQTGAARSGSIEGGAGNDTLAVSAGTVDADVAGDGGDDAVVVSGGTVGGAVTGGAGDDTVAVRGGTVQGGITAETVQLSGGMIGGDIAGISADTLVIDDTLADPALDLADGVAFSGTDAVGTITDTDLAAAGEHQNFSGFDRLTLDGSTLRFGAAEQGIGALFLADGSTLFVQGPTTLRTDEGFGDLSVVNSTLDLADGDPTDTLTVGGLVLDGATIGVDIDQDSGLADSIAANGAVTAAGDNTILVNLIGEPAIEEIAEIPIVSADGAPIGGNFSVAGIGGTTAALFDYEIVRGPDGGLLIRATPSNESVGTVTAVDGAAASAAAENLVESLNSIANEAARKDLGLAGGLTGAAGAPSASSFGVFASGQLAHTGHDGFTISDGDESFRGPSFSSDDFSGAVSLDFNAAKYFGFDGQYGLNLGLFAGYASTDVDLDGFRDFDDAGSAENESGMAGGYALIRRELNYVLLSGTTLFGQTDSRNDISGSHGDYDTFGYALTASAGHIFAIGDKARFDLRGGVLGASFKGDGYRDSDGLEHDESRVSFGAVKFEPGIYADYALDNGMVFSPYARLELQQRFSYRNESGVEDEDFAFDDADFSGAVMGGANLKISDSMTVSSELRGKFSADSSTFAGKLGLKVAF